MSKGSELVTTGNDDPDNQNQNEEGDRIATPQEQRFIRKITQKFSMDKLMMMLDKKKLEALEEEFQQHPDGIKLGNFVWLMKAAIAHNEDEKFDLVYGLQKLFAEIDINGDEHMEWSEFTQYIIDAVIQNPHTKAKSKDILMETKMMKYRKYFPSKFKDKTSHNAFVQNAIWCHKFQCIMMLEHNQKFIKMLNPGDLSTKFTISLPPQKKEVYIIDIDYCNEYQTFGVIDSDCNIMFWDYYINLKLFKTIKSPCLQTKMKYLKNHKTWLTIGSDNIMREYDLRKKEPFVVQIEGHKEGILDIIELDNPFAIASASLDTTIRIFSLVDNEDISVLKEHEKGVRMLSYNPNFGGFIISVGFERNVYVWSPEVTQKKSLIGKLEGHTEIVVAARFLNMKPFCVSIDEKYNFRFWDVRTLTCVQVIANEMNAQVPVFGLFVFPFQERFVVFSKRLLFYDTKKKDTVNQAKSSSEDVNPIKAEFNQYYQNFAIMTHHDIRIYSAKEGKLQKIIQNLVDPATKAPLTAFTLDDKQRKIYIGDNAGGIRTYNISNGVFIKHVQKSFLKKKQEIFDLVNEMDSHEVSSLAFLNLENHETNLLVTSSWDSSLQIFDEELPDESHLLRVSVGGHGKEDICCMTVSPDLSLIATGSCSGIIAIWDFESTKVEGYLMEHNKQISSLHILYPLSVLISTCNEGYACIWGLQQAPLDYRYRLLKKVRNNLTDPDMSFLKMNITCCKTKFLKTDKLFSSPVMILGDESGYINKWDLTPLIKELRSIGFKDIQSISRFKMSFNPKKNATVNALSSAQTLIFFAEQNAKKMKPVNSSRSVKAMQWFAHQGQLNSINFLENPDGVITCSVDKHVKLWSIEGELWGDINLMKENYDKRWCYPCDWSEKKEKEIERVKTLMTVVDHPPPPGVIEDVIFDQKVKKEKDERQLIDYLAKRQRRIDLEENIRRQQERQVMLQNQEQMRAQYVSQQMQYSENVCSDNYKLEVIRMTEDGYQAAKSGLVLAMDRQFDQMIENATKKLIRNASGKDGIGTEGAKSPGELTTEVQSPNTVTNRRYTVSKNLSSVRVDSRKSEYGLASGAQSAMMMSPMGHLHQSQISAASKVSYPKQIPSSLKKDKNQEFNNKILGRTFLQSRSEATLPALQQDNDQNQGGKSTIKVTFNNTPMSFTFYDPPQEVKSTIQYETALKPFTPSMMTPNNFKGALTNVRSQVNNTQSRHIKPHYDSGLMSPQDRGSSAISVIDQMKPLSSQLSTKNTSNNYDQYYLKTNKLALTQNRKSMKIAHLAENVNKFGRRLEYALKSEASADQMSQQQQQQQQQLPISSGFQSEDATSEQQTKMSKVHSAKQLISPKQRKILIGMEGNNSGSKFLKRLNNFISQYSQPQSKQSERISNIRYTQGEGMRLLKISYNDVQFKHRVLHTSEFGYRRKKPEPQLKSIFHQGSGNGGNNDDILDV